MKRPMSWKTLKILACGIMLTRYKLDTSCQNFVHLRLMEIKKRKSLSNARSANKQRADLEKFYQQVIKNFGYEYQRRV